MNRVQLILSFGLCFVGGNIFSLLFIDKDTYTLAAGSAIPESPTNIKNPPVDPKIPVASSSSLQKYAALEAQFLACKEQLASMANQSNTLEQTQLDTKTKLKQA